MHNILLSLRQRKILQSLKYKTEYVTGKELANELNVSSRTIRNDINEINNLLKESGIVIESKRSVGYLLQTENSAELAHILKINASFLSRDDRIRYILYRLCVEEDPINLYDLEDEMFISSTTLDIDIQTLNKNYILEYPFIKFYKKKNFISLESDELKRRIILNHIFTENWDYNSTGNAFYNYQGLDNDILVLIMSEIKIYLNEYNVRLEDLSMVELGLGISIAYFRIQNGFYITKTSSHTTNDKFSIHLIDDILDSLENKLDVKFPQNDRIPFYYFMASSKLLNAKLLNFRTVKDYFDHEIIEMCDEYIQKIKDVFHLDFSSDEDFYITTLQLFRSIKVPFRRPNKLITQEYSLRTQYLIEFEIAYLIQPLALKYFGSYFNYSEITYLTFCISGALSYYNRTLPKINTVILCHHNLSVAWNLKHTVLENFSDFIDIHELLPVYTKDMREFNDIDLILSTVNKNMTTSVSCKSLQISPFFTERDRHNLHHYIHSTRIEHLYNNTNLSLYDLLDNASWIESSNCSDFFDALKLLYNELTKELPLDVSFLASIMQRESILTFAHHPHVSFVYQIGDYEKTSACAMTLDHRIQYHDNKIRIIVLVAIAKNDSNFIFKMLNELFNSDFNLNDLKFLKTKKEILNALKTYIL